MAATEKIDSSPRRVAFYDFELDLTSGDLSHDGVPVHLATQPAEVLKLLAERPGELILRSEIQDHVWGDLVIEQEQGLNTCIRQVRLALGDRASPPRFIETVPRRGYRFIAPVRRPAHTAAVIEAAETPAARGPAASRPPGYRRSVFGAIALGLLALTAITQRPWSPTPEESASDKTTATAVIGVKTPQPPVPETSGATSQAHEPAATETISVDPAAREAYLRGRYLLEHGPRRDPARAEVELERALELDPGLALAHVALADAYHGAPGDDSIERQRAALLTALELDPDLAEAHLRLAKIRLYADWGFEAAGRSFERAHKLAPDNPEILRQYALYLAQLRRHDEAIERIERARQLDPVSVAVHGNGASIYFAARRYEQVVEVCRRALELAPDHFIARTYLLHAHHQMGRNGQAREQAVELMRRLGATAAELRGVAEHDNPESALQRFFEWQLEWLRAQGAPPVAMAAALLPLGRVDDVFIWLENAYQRHDGDLLLIAGDPRADAFRGDPRFVDLLRRIGFPADTIER